MLLAQSHGHETIVNKLLSHFVVEDNATVRDEAEEVGASSSKIASTSASAMDIE
jgi:hypothetical protein